MSRTTRASATTSRLRCVNRGRRSLPSGSSRRCRCSGFPPEKVHRAGQLNLLYQFWIHTEAIDRLPEPIELVFNTPSHHRVHHGSNRQYLDKNYGGILIVWDRLFGTFEKEVRRVRYGLTKNITTYNPRQHRLPRVRRHRARRAIARARRASEFATSSVARDGDRPTK